MTWWNPFSWRNHERSKAAEMAALAIKRLRESEDSLKCHIGELAKIEQSAASLLAEVEKKTSAILNRARMISEAAAEDVEGARKRIERGEAALEALRSENQVMAEVEIARLMAFVDREKQRDEADIAESNFRKAAASPRSVEREY